MKRQNFLIGLSILLLAAIALSLPSGQAQAQPNEPYVPSGILVTELDDRLPPGRLNIRFPPRDPVVVGEEIRQLLQQPRSSQGKPASAQIVPEVTPEIEALAAGLSDPLAIYDYVHNHIDYIPTWGLLKNPRETWLAGAGNAFDQAALLSALLEAANVPHRFVWGNVDISKSQAMNWVGANDPAVVGTVFASGGIPTIDTGSSLRLTHIWVEVCDGGTGPGCSGGAWRPLDPSFKSYSEQSGQDLRPKMGYDLPTFIGRAESGAAIDPDYVQNLNHSNIQTDLQTYASNLVSDLRNDNPFIYLEDLIGGRRIDPVESTGYPPLPYTIDTTSGTAAAIPDTFAYELSIQIPAVGLAYTEKIDNIAGERITIFYDCATPGDCQTLESAGDIFHLQPTSAVNVVPKLRIGGQVVATGSSSTPLWPPAGQQLNVTITTPGGGQSFSFSQFLTVGEWYALPMRLQTVSARAMARHANLLDEALAQGADVDDEAVLGQMLYLMGLAYFNEVDVGDRIDSQLGQVVHAPHFSMMLASRSLIFYTDDTIDPDSHSVDVQLNLDTVISAANPASTDRERAWFLSAGIRGSAAEHAIHEQLQPREPGQPSPAQPFPAVSTIQILKTASERGQRIYYVTAANWSAVSTQLSDHATHVYNSVMNDVLVNGKHVVIHDDPVTYVQWTGSGWISLDPLSGSAGYLISGSNDPFSTRASLIINGGGGAFTQRASLRNKAGRGENTRRGADVLKSTFKPAEVQVHFSEQHTADPVSVAGGTFAYRHQDMAPLGGLGIPLGFDRFYASSRHNLARALGFGWSHTYDTRFFTSSDWIRGYGGRMALEAAPALAAVRVSLDLFATPPIPHQRYTIDATIAHRLMAQITENSATIVEANGRPAAHIRLPGGTYQPPAGTPNLSAVTVVPDSGATLAWEDGRQMHFDGEGRLTALNDPNGNQTTLNYDAQGRLATVSDAVGRNLTFSYDAQGRLGQLTGPAGRLFRFSYDGQGNLQTYTDPENEVITYAYDGDHRLTGITDQRWTTYITNHYDGLGRVTRQIDGRGGQTDLRYAGGQTVVTDPLSYQTTYFYDDRSRLLGIEDALGRRTTVAYDAAGHEVSRTDRLGQTTTFAYDTRDRLTTTTDPGNQTLIWTYDSAGNPASYTDQRDKTWHFSYDGGHNLTGITDPLGNVFTYTYNSLGQLTRVQDPAAIPTTYSYDAHGNLTCLTNALNEQQCLAYDGVGRPTSFTDGAGKATQFSYDATGHLIRVTDPLGNQTNYGYDATGNLDTLSDANGHQTSYTYDQHFNLTAVTDHLGQTTNYAYDANDGLIRLTDARGHITRFERDQVGRVTKISDPLSRDTTFTYDAADRLMTFTRADGSQVSYQRDELGRVTRIDHPHDPDTLYAYDEAGNLIDANYAGKWRAGYTYDDGGRLTTVEDTTRNLTTTYTYDSAGRRAALQVDSAGNRLYHLTYHYDPAGRLARLVDQIGAPATTISFAYDSAGRPATITDLSGAHSDYAYDDAGRPVQVQHQDDQNNLVARYDYAYDGVGNRTAVTDTTPGGIFATTYNYDSLDRLVTETTPGHTISYAYDAAGNLTQRTDPKGAVVYTYDNANQLQSRDGETFSYDSNGNLTNWQSAQGSFGYTYDDEDRLTKLSLPQGGNLAFTYDAFGRRLTLHGPVDTAGFLYDGLSVIVEGAADFSQMSAGYLYYRDLLLARRTGRLGLTRYRGDALANVRYVTDGNGQPIDAYRYDAFGRPAHPAGIDANPFRFGGQHSLYQNRVPGWPALLSGFRYYDPTGGRFLTPDPLPGNLALPASLNAYSYAFNNPVRYSDPTGLRSAENATQAAYEQSLSFAQNAGSARNAEAGLNRVTGNLGGPLQSGGGSSARRSPESGLAQVRRSLGGLTNRVSGAKRSTTNGPAPGRAGSTSAAVAAVNESGQVRSRRSAAAGLGGNITGYAGSGGILSQQPNGRGLVPSTFDLDKYWSAYWDRYWSEYWAWYNDYYRSFGSNGGFPYAKPQANRWVAIAPHGTTYALACTTGNHLLAGAFHTGLFSSSDSRHDTWDNHYAASVGELVISDTTTYYAGTWSGGVIKSNDGGASWGTLNSGLSANDAYALVIDPASAGRIFAGTEMGLFASIDGGATWNGPNSALPGRLVSELAFAGNNLLAVTDIGLYRSLDRGTNWLTPTVNLPPVQINVLLASSPGSTVYAGTALGLYRSTDGGDTWATFGTGLTGNDIHALAIDPADANHMLAGTTEGLFVSTDGGLLWTPDPGGGLDGIASQIGAITFCPGGGEANLYLGAGGGVYAYRIPVAITTVEITGALSGSVGSDYSFSATVDPPEATQPITYTWEATGNPQPQSSIINSGGLSDTVTFRWGISGSQTITVTADNGVDPAVVDTHTINITKPAGVRITSVEITGPLTGFVRTAYTFTATVGPPETTPPITYTWEATDDPLPQSPIVNTGGLSNIITFSWNISRSQTITVTVNNGPGPSLIDTHTVTINDTKEGETGHIYLPIVLRNYTGPN